MHERRGRFQIHDSDHQDDSDHQVAEELKEWKRHTTVELRATSPRWVRWFGGIFLSTIFAVLMSGMILFIRWMWVVFW